MRPSPAQAFSGYRLRFLSATKVKKSFCSTNHMCSGNTRQSGHWLHCACPQFIMDLWLTPSKQSDVPPVRALYSGQCHLLGSASGQPWHITMLVILVLKACALRTHLDLSICRTGVKTCVYLQTLPYLLSFRHSPVLVLRPGFGGSACLDRQTNQSHQPSPSCTFYRLVHFPVGCGP
jgi:hypothetical protein